MPEQIGVVITGGDFQALGVLRSLARKDIPVAVLDHEHCISRYSRFPKRYIQAPAPSDHAAYAQFLIDLADRQDLRGWVIFPNSDETVYVLSRHKEALEQYYRVPTPSWQTIQHVYIKENTYRLAQAHGIPTPRTYYPKNVGELESLDLDYPAVIKPSIRDHFYSKTKIKALRVNTHAELLATYHRVCDVIDPSEVLVQELIPGGADSLYSFCPFFKDGRTIAYVMARRTRQHPMDFGHASTFVEIVDVPEMRTIGERFLSLIDYSGIGEVEFMRDPRDGVYKLLEVNPRFWGWHSLAIAAGIDLPYLWYRDAIGQPVQAVCQQPEAMKWVRLLTDTPTALSEILKGNMSLRDYWRSMTGKKTFAVFAADDPMPFFMELCLSPYLWLKRGF